MHMMLRFARGRRDDLKTLSPGYFAMVMATGIVAVSAHLHDLVGVGRVLFWLNTLFLGGLVLATIVRVLAYARDVAADMRSHRRGVGFFTMAAAAAVFGAEVDLQMDQVRVAMVFWAIATVLWLVMTYGLLAVLMAQRDKPSLAHGLNGGWLVIVVAPQSVVILAVLLLAHGAFADLAPSLMFGALVLWLGGGALYLWISTLVVFRYAFAVLAPEDLSPTDWINMGAAAISTLAGATLAQHAALSPLVTEIAPFVKGFTLFFWAIATAWIPMLVVLSLWRHLICGLPIAYQALDWGGVFPLGMYSASTLSLREILDAPFLGAISWMFMAIALAAWLWAFIGFLISRLGGTTGVAHSQG
jgi:tellurite resistance protein TehA-like permease